jgi:hypothetical protein
MHEVEEGCHIEMLCIQIDVIRGHTMILGSWIFFLHSILYVIQNSCRCFKFVP